MDFQEISKDLSSKMKAKRKASKTPWNRDALNRAAAKRGIKLGTPATPGQVQAFKSGGISNASSAASTAMKSAAKAPTNDYKSAIERRQTTGKASPVSNIGNYKKSGTSTPWGGLGDKIRLLSAARNSSSNKVV